MGSVHGMGPAQQPGFDGVDSSTMDALLRLAEGFPTDKNAELQATPQQVATNVEIAQDRPGFEAIADRVGPHGELRPRAEDVISAYAIRGQETGSGPIDPTAKRV